jgi:hypothetical protein
VIDTVSTCRRDDPVAINFHRNDTASLSERPGHHRHRPGSVSVLVLAHPTTARYEADDLAVFAGARGSHDCALLMGCGDLRLGGGLARQSSAGVHPQPGLEPQIEGALSGRTGRRCRPGHDRARFADGASSPRGIRRVMPPVSARVTYAALTPSMSLH